MMRVASLLILSCLLLSCSWGQLLKFVPGRELSYNVVGTVDSRGQQASGSRSGGSNGNLQGTLVAKCLSANSTMALFVMNMFNVNVGVAQGAGVEDSLMVTSGDNPMGYDMYFYQTMDGSIPLVEYESDDSPFYVNVKLSAINAFQTSLKTGVVQVTDPTGVHTAAFVQQQQVTIANSFSAKSYSSFMDPNVNANNVQIGASGYVTFHPTDGSIVSAGTQQHVVVVTGAMQERGTSGKADDNDTSGYDMYMSSMGAMNLTFTAAVSGRVGKLVTLSNTKRVSGTPLECARNVHSVIQAEKAQEVAQNLMKETVTRIVPHICTAPVRKALAHLVHGKLGMSVKSKAKIGQLLQLASLCDSGRTQQQKGPRAALRRPRQLSLPFNESGSVSLKIGGSAIGVEFDASFLVGTNLNCKNPSFAYEATADVQANLKLFGESAQAFDANIIYGQNGGSPLADAATLTAFGKVVWQEALPQEAYCQSHTYPIGGGVQRGISASHTVWVSIVPVTFVASANVDLNLSWQWEICTNDLSASIGITPSAAFAFGGGAEVDLLVLRAGVNLDATFSVDVVPSADVAGTACDVGVQIQEDTSADSGYLQGYYAWRHCKYWIFDCHWGEHHQKNFWQHSGTTGTKTLFNKQWPIA